MPACWTHTVCWSVSMRYQTRAPPVSSYCHTGSGFPSTSLVAKAPLSGMWRAARRRAWLSRRRLSERAKVAFVGGQVLHQLGVGVHVRRVAPFLDHLQDRTGFCSRSSAASKVSTSSTTKACTSSRGRKTSSELVGMYLPELSAVRKPAFRTTAPGRARRARRKCAPARPARRSAATAPRW